MGYPAVKDGNGTVAVHDLLVLVTFKQRLLSCDKLWASELLVNHNVVTL